jgi:rod shape-determining protein MreB
MIHLLRGLRSSDVAVDLGTATTRVAALDPGEVLRSPSTFAGVDALRGGVVSNQRCATEIVRRLLRRATRGRLRSPRVLACVPSNASDSEREAVETTVRAAGATSVALVLEPLAAALGSEIDVAAPCSHLVVDVGHGVTDCAVIREGLVIHTMARRVACFDLENACRDFVRSRHGAVLPATEMWRLLGRLDFADAGRAASTASVRAQACVTGMPVEVEVDLFELMLAVAPVHEAIASLVREFVVGLPDEIGAEIAETGIHLSGGGALLAGLAESLSRNTGLTVTPSRDPLNAVIRGAQKILPTLDAISGWS